MARSRDQGERRRQIVDSATRSALRRGLFQLRLKEVAADLGVTEGAVLYYYPSLDELRLQVFARATERWYAARELVVADDVSAITQLVRHVHAGLSLQIPELRLLSEPVSGVSILPAYRAIAESLFVREVSRYQLILERGTASGEFTLQSDAFDAARNLVTLEENYRLHVLAETAITVPVGLKLILTYAELVTSTTSLRDAALSLDPLSHTEVESA